MRQLEIEPGDGVRSTFIVAFGAIGYHEAEPRLTPMLQNSNPMIRGVAAWSLGVLHATQSQKALQAALAKETDSYARPRMQEALIQMSAPGRSTAR